MLRFRVGDLVRVRDPRSLPDCRTKPPEFISDMDIFYESGKIYRINQVFKNDLYTLQEDQVKYLWLDEWLEYAVRILVDHSQQTVIQFPEE